ncbi:hypothetical protein [Jiangella sp. DSM 45060]|uniref:hypothetical protein n=1 Tax=Jiangella sp. DSM 45060 TaxID=1798224 RepID=UPI00087B49F1|nr:hypothetical protein [Jiangella sp. DSM 45060]SDS54182.1 hypothetical protein SAMN04515669_1327 [Jiangella sp. DSM 45060]
MSRGNSLSWATLSPSGRDSAEWSHAGIAADAGGTVYWTDPAGGAIIARHLPTEHVERIPVPLLEVHDITLGPSGDRLWLVDPGWKQRPPAYEPEVREGRAGVLDLASGTFTDLVRPDHPHYAQHGWYPTSIAVDGTESLVVVADGYGESLVHLFRDGAVTTVQGAGGARFRCPHGVLLLAGASGAELVVADRGNSRLVRLDLDGHFVDAFTHPDLRSPSGLAALGERLVVTDLDGALHSVDLDRGLLDVLVPFPDGEKRPGWPNHQSDGAMVRPPLRDGLLNSPHGVATGPDGSIFLTEWVIGGRELHLRPGPATENGAVR